MAVHMLNAQPDGSTSRNLETASLPRGRTAVSGKRVLIVMNCDEGGGVEHLANVLRDDLKHHDAKVEFLFLYERGVSTRSAKLRGISRAMRAIVSQRPDVVIAFQPTSSVIAGVVGRLSGCPLRLIHQSNVPQSTHPLPRLLDKVVGTLGFYTVNIMNSAATKAAFADYPSRYRKYLHHIDHGIDWRPAAKTRAEVLAKYALPDGPSLLLSCARLVPQKSLDTVVAALPLLPGVHFALAGQGPDGVRLARMALELGVHDRLHFIGLVPHQDLFDLYAAVDAFVFPSVWETFGLAAVEAAMQGLPVIASDLAVTHEVLTVGGESPATFVGSRDPEHWAKAIVGVLNDPAALGRAGSFAHAIRAKYSQEGMLRAYRDVFEAKLA